MVCQLNRTYICYVPGHVFYRSPFVLLLWSWQCNDGPEKVQTELDGLNRWNVRWVAHKTSFRTLKVMGLWKESY